MTPLCIRGLLVGGWEVCLAPFFLDLDLDQAGFGVFEEKILIVPAENKKKCLKIKRRGKGNEPGALFLEYKKKSEFETH